MDQAIATIQNWESTRGDRMNKRNRCLVLLVLFLFLFSCVTPLKKKIPAFETIQYEGVITPVSIPIKPEYKPAKFKFHVSEVTQELPPNEKSTITEESYGGVSAVSKMGDLLLWEMKILNAKTDGSYYSPNIPLADFRWLSDKYGTVKEVEGSFPDTDRRWERAIKKLKLPAERANTKPDKSMFRHMILSDKPIKSGDIFYKVPPLGLTELEFIDPKEIKGKVFGYILKGWSYYKGKKVLVAEIDTTMNFTDKERTDFVVKKFIEMGYIPFTAKAMAETSIPKITVKYKGYSLIDPKTYIDIESQWTAEIKYREGTIRVYISGSIEIKH